MRSSGESNPEWASAAVVFVGVLACALTLHLHSAKVMPFTSYRGTLYGVDDGCLCEPDHQAFLYLEDNPKKWRSGFCVLRFVGGRLLQPQLALVHDEKHIDFCGKLHGI